MKKLILLLAFLVIHQVQAATPIQNLMLQGNANGNSNALTNVFLNLKAGNTNGIPPITFHAGRLKTTATDGIFEYDGTNYYMTIGSTRQSITLGGGPGPAGTVTNVGVTAPITGGGTLNAVIGFDGTVSHNASGATNLTSTAISGLIPIVNLASGSGDTTKFLRYDQTWAVPAGGGGGGGIGVNYLLNSEFDFYQRQTNATVMERYVDATYGPDRWKVLSSTGTANASVGVQQISNPFQTAIYAGRFSALTNAAQIGIYQPIEGVNCQNLRGQSVTLSGNVRITGIATNAVRFAILQWDSTVDTITADPVSTWNPVPNFVANMTTASTPGTVTCTASGTWYSFMQTTTMNSTFNNMAVIIYSNDSLATTVTMDIANVKLEIGSSATSYSRQLPTAASELLACQRYFETINFDGNVMLSTFQAFANYGAVGPVNFRATKRVAPTVTANSTSFYLLSASAQNCNCTNVTFSGTVDLLKGVAYTTNGLSAGNATCLQSVTPTNRITLDSEL